MHSFEYMSNDQRKSEFVSIAQGTYGNFSIDEQTSIFEELQKNEYASWNDSGILKKIVEQVPEGHKLGAISLQARVWARHSTEPEIISADFRITTSSNSDPDEMSSTDTISVFEEDEHGIRRPGNTFSASDVHLLATQLQNRQALQREGFLPNLSEKDLSSIEDYNQ